MNLQQQIIVTTLFITHTSVGIIRDFSICHDDFTLKPADGILNENTFTWLAFVKYVHVTTGLPHQTRAPRAVLVHKQFVLGSATDLLRLPNNYKLENIVFGHYERVERECGLTVDRIKMGVTCPRAYLEMPITRVTPHPEYTRFGVVNSLALVTLLSPLQSEYTLPICLPSLQERNRRRTSKMVFMVDYISTVPRDFDTERLGKKTMKMYTHEECRKYKRKMKASEGITHALCSSGCGVRAGAPLVSHNPEGQFELLGLAVGGGPCSRRSMRRSLNPEPPVYIDVYPYEGWIINVITAHAIPKPYPNNFRLVDTKSGVGYHLRNKKEQKVGWVGRTYVCGDFCFRSLKTQFSKASVFYSEKFEVNADPPAKLNVYLEVSAGIETTIVCARLQMPNRNAMPTIEGVGRYNITITFATKFFPYNFYFSLALTGRNSTRKNKQLWQHEQKPGFL